ncbi:MAG: hypothetical protein ACFE96_02715 [Candidatus Hermodarchaeota archaeon]
MAIIFGYWISMSLIIDIVEGVFLVLVYVMFILSSKNQPRENKSSQLLRIAGITGIMLTVLAVALPNIMCVYCDSLEFLLFRIYGFSVILISLIPMLFSLGISLLLVGIRNREMYGQVLKVSGILWIIAFVGYVIGYLAIMFFMITQLFFLTTLSYVAIPAVILMIVHGGKYKDRYFVLAGVFYIISWFFVVFLPWVPYLPI